MSDNTSSQSSNTEAASAVSTASSGTKLNAAAQSFVPRFQQPPPQQQQQPPMEQFMMHPQALPMYYPPYSAVPMPYYPPYADGGMYYAQYQPGPQYNNRQSYPRGRGNRAGGQFGGYNGSQGFNPNSASWEPSSIPITQKPSDVSTQDAVDTGGSAFEQAEVTADDTSSAAIDNDTIFSSAQVDESVIVSAVSQAVADVPVAGDSVPLEKAAESPSSKFSGLIIRDEGEDENSKKAVSVGKTVSAVAGFIVEDTEDVPVTQSPTKNDALPSGPASTSEKGKSGAGAGADWTRRPKAPAAADDSNDAWTKVDASQMITIADMLSRNDGVKRYDKMRLMTLNTTKKMVPPEIKAFYPFHSKTERFPRAPKGMKAPVLLEDSTPHEDEIKIFSGEGVFRVDASKIVNPDDPDVIIRKATLILNQLSETNFERLSDDFMAAGIDRHDLMGRVVEMIVMKAQLEEHFCNMYANLVRKMSKRWSKTVPVSSDKTSGATEDPVPASEKAIEPDLGAEFRALLLARASQEFQTDRAAAIEAIKQRLDLSPEDREEKEIILKTKFAGMMRFVGELYLVEIIKSKVVESCLDGLLRTEVEEDLMCLNKIIKTVGSKYDSVKKNKAHLDIVFKKIDELRTSHKSSRVRFLFADLIDLRNNAWQDRREAVKAFKIGEGSSNSAASTPAQNGGKPKTPGSAGAATVAPRFGSQDVRAQVTKASAPVNDEWSTVSTGKKGKAVPAPAPLSNPKAKIQSAGNGGMYSMLSSPEKGRRNGKESGANEEKSPKRAVRSAESSRKSAESREDIPSSLTLSTETLESYGQSSPAIELAGENGAPLDKEMLLKMRACMEEYLATELAEEVIADFSTRIHPNAMGDVFKYLVNAIMEKKDEDRVKFCRFWQILHEAELFSPNEALRGVLLFLNDLDDVAMDVPKVEAYFATIVASLVAHGMITLSFLASIPDENNFSFSYRKASFLGHILNRLTALKGTAEAEAAYRTSEVDLKEWIVLEPKQTIEDALGAYAAANGLSFAL